MSTATGVYVSVLYVQATAPESDALSADQLHEAAPNVRVTPVSGAATALAMLRRGLAWQGVLISPAVPRRDLLSLISCVRRDRLPVAIVPIVAPDQQDLFAAALAAGADDVLIQKEAAVSLAEGLSRIQQGGHLHHEHVRQLTVQYAGEDQQVWDLVSHLPFVSAARTTVPADGSCPHLDVECQDGHSRADVLIVDNPPAEISPVQVLRAVKQEVLDLTVLLLLNPGQDDVADAARAHGADAAILKDGDFTQALLAALHGAHRRLEATAGLDDVRRQERAGWEDERQRLMARLDEAASVAAERDELARRLDVVTIDLARTAQSFAEERGKLEAELRTVRAELWNEHRDRETTLANTEAELASLRRLLDDERGAWAPQERALREEVSSLQARISALTAEHDDQRARWDEERQALEQARERALSALEVERAAWRGERIAIDEERRRLAEQLEAIDGRGGSERLLQIEQASQNWDREKAALAERIEALERELDEAADQARRERARLVSLHAQEQEEWRKAIARLREERDRLASRSRDTGDGAAQGTPVDPPALDLAIAERDAARAEILQTDATHRAEREAWRAERERLTSRLAELEAALAHAQSHPAVSGPTATPDDGVTRHEALVDMDAFAYGETAAGTGELLTCNFAFARLFGYADVKDVLSAYAGRPFPALAGRTDVAAQLRDFGRIDRRDSYVERRDGRPVRVREWARLVSAAGGSDSAPVVQHVLVTGPDVRADVERQSRRLQEVGALAASMVPELEALSNVMSGQARQLIAQLAAFSRRQTRTPEQVDLREVVAQQEPGLARLAGNLVTFSTDVDAVTPITALADEVHQLLTSLVTFGRDLLPAGGSLVMAVRQQRPASGSEPGPLLSIDASGYGVQAPGPCTTLDQLVHRIGGRLNVIVETGWSVRVEVLFPMCPPIETTAWDWMWE
jgi:DNA-binding NarL/FixJ family response regulator